MNKTNNEQELIRIAIDIHHKSLLTYLGVLISITVLQFGFFSLLIQGRFSPVGIIKIILSGGILVYTGLMVYLVLELLSTYTEIIHLRENLGINTTFYQLRQDLRKKSSFLRMYYKTFRKHHWESDETGVRVGFTPKLIAFLLILGILFMCYLILSAMWGSNSAEPIQSIEGMDYDLFFFINQVDNPNLNSFFIFLSLIFSHFLFLLINTIIWLRRPKLGTLLLISLGIASTFLFVTKVIVSRPRPPQVLSNVKVLDSFEGSSFPSGHSTRAFLLASIVGSSYTKTVIPLVVFSSLVAISRVYVGVHFPTDIIAGSIVGLVLGRALYNYQNVFHPILKISKRVHTKLLGFILRARQ